MVPEKTNDRINKVMQQFKDNAVTRIVLTGERGIGKTWTARKVLEQARQSYGAENNYLDFGFTLWVSMNQNFDELSLYDKISSQLILPSNQGEKDNDDDEDDDGLDQERQVDENKELMLEKLKKNIKAKLANKRYLLVMDDEGNGITDSFLMEELKKVLPPIAQRNSKILITKTENDDTPTIEGYKKIIAVEPLHEEESCELLHGIVESKLQAIASQLRAIASQSRAMAHEVESHKLLHGIVESKSQTIASQSQAIPSQSQAIAHEVESHKQLHGIVESKSQAIASQSQAIASQLQYIASQLQAITSQSQAITSLSQAIAHEVESHKLRHGILESKSQAIASVLQDITSQSQAIASQLQDITSQLQATASQSQAITPQSQAITQMCNNLPDQIIVITNLLMFLWELDDGVGNFDTILKEIVNVNDYKKATDLLVSEFANIPRLNMKFPDIKAADMKFACSWYSRRIFEASKCSIHYNDLITYWILEGCLGHVDEIDKAYDAGHTLLLELINLGLLTKHDDNFVSMNQLFLEVKDHRRYGFRGIASLGLENIFHDDIWVGVGKLSKSIQKDRKYNEKVSALLIDSHRLSREVPESLFKRFSSLRVLGLFNPTFESIPTSFSYLQQLNVLVIRACPFLNKVDSIEELRNLIVLEITGATSLKEMPDALFKNMSRLQTISFSAGNIISIPKISDQLNLRRIILRNCPCLQKVPLIPKCKDLEVIDVSGCTSLGKFDDVTFQDFLELQFLDVSNTKVDSLPLLKKLKKLNRLILSDTLTPKLRILADLTGLEIIDISKSEVIREVKGDELTNKTALRVIDFSGTQITSSFQSTVTIKKLERINLSNNISFKRFEDASLEHLEYLRVLDVSKTSIEKLPNLTNLPNLRHLVLKDCSLLKELGKMEGLTKLEKIDLSNANILKTIENLNHENLRSVVLQGCGDLQKLPSLAKATKLEELDLSGCVSLKEIEDQSFDHFIALKKLKLSKTKIPALPSLSTLTNLEELDLSGINSLKVIPYDLFLQYMDHLQILNLSGTQQVTRMSLSHLLKIKELRLNGCTGLDQVTDLEKLTELEILDLSNTKISSLPSLISFPNLRELLLSNASNIEKLIDLESVRKLEVLDLFGTGLEDFPYEISHLACLNKLSLPKLNGRHINWGRVNWLPEVNIEECGIFKPAETKPGSGNAELSITVTSTTLFEFFEKIPNLWETHFTKFHIFVCSPEYIADRDHPLLFGPEADMFRKIYNIHTTKSIEHHDHTRCLDIRGFDTIPSNLNNVLKYAEYVSIKDNKSNKSLQNMGGDKIKRFSIERCNEMEDIFKVEKENEDARLARDLEVLCVSNMAKLKNVLYTENKVLHVESFISLKEMYLDCCPKLVTLFTSEKTPENLEIIDIKFCDKLEAVFGNATLKMPKLHTLRLLQLPQLKIVGYELKSLEKLDVIRIQYCDSLKKFSEETSLTLPSLRELHLESLPKLEPIGFPTSPHVQTKHVEECPLLKPD